MGEDCGSLARAVSDGSLNQVLEDAGERRLKSSTLQLLRLAGRERREACEPLGRRGASWSERR